MTYEIKLLLIPIVGALIGWIFTRMAVKQLFRTLLKKQPQIAQQIGASAKDLINLDQITAKLKDPQQLLAVNPIIENHIDSFLRVRLAEKIPMIGMFIGESTIGQLKDGMMEEINTLLPEVIGKYADGMSQKVNIEKMVSDKIAGIPANKLEELLRIAVGKELHFVEIMGAALGLVIGLVQVGIMLL